jgi:hypothetical protein
VKGAKGTGIAATRLMTTGTRMISTHMPVNRGILLGFP